MLIYLAFAFTQAPFIPVLHSRWKALECTNFRVINILWGDEGVNLLLFSFMSNDHIALPPILHCITIFEPNA